MLIDVTCSSFELLIVDSVLRCLRGEYERHSPADQREEHRDDAQH